MYFWLGYKRELAGGKMSEDLLKLQNIKKSFNNYLVLDDISINLKKAEIVSLLGPSGSGKTTLFRIAAGLVKPDTGQVILANKIRKSFVFQEPRLLPWKTVSENLRFVQDNYSCLDRAEELRNSLLKASGLYDFKESFPAELSGGMKQRLELIRALAIKPDLIFMDEPFKSVDTRTRINLMKLLSVIQAETKISILMITHNPEEAVLLADRIYVLSDKTGKIIKKFQINQPRSKRNIRNNDLYDTINEINQIFKSLIGEMDVDLTKLSGHMQKQRSE